MEKTNQMIRSGKINKMYSNRNQPTFTISAININGKFEICTTKSEGKAFMIAQSLYPDAYQTLVIE